MNLDRKRILIIDDEIAIHAVVKLSLQMQAGWETIATSSSFHGLELARCEQPDIILLDLMMPEMSGSDLLKQLKADRATRSIPVIFLTAKMKSLQQDFFKNLGAAGAIAKPFNSLTLSTEIAALVGW